MITNTKNQSFQDIYMPGEVQNGISNLVQEHTGSGSGQMCCFDVAPGIRITYNDLNMDSCFRPIRFEKDFLQINHCLEGCYECELEGGAVSFLGEGCFECITKKIELCKFFLLSSVFIVTIHNRYSARCFL